MPYSTFVNLTVRTGGVESPAAAKERLGQERATGFPDLLAEAAPAAPPATKDTRPNARSFSSGARHCDQATRPDRRRAYADRSGSDDRLDGARAVPRPEPAGKKEAAAPRDDAEDVVPAHSDPAANSESATETAATPDAAEQGAKATPETETAKSDVDLMLLAPSVPAASGDPAPDSAASSAAAPSLPAQDPALLVPAPVAATPVVPAPGAIAISDVQAGQGSVTGPAQIAASAADPPGVSAVAGSAGSARPAIKAPASAASDATPAPDHAAGSEAAKPAAAGFDLASLAQPGFRAGTAATNGAPEKPGIASRRPTAKASEVLADPTAPKAEDTTVAPANERAGASPPLPGPLDGAAKEPPAPNAAAPALPGTAHQAPPPAAAALDGAAKEPADPNAAALALPGTAHQASPPAAAALPSAALPSPDNVLGIVPIAAGTRADAGLINVAPTGGTMARGGSDPVPLSAVGVEIAARASEGKHRFEIRLDPPELGRIEVRLDVRHDGQVTSRLVVERAETLDLLRRDAPALERALQSAGLQTDGSALQFSLRDQSGGGRWSAPDTPARPNLMIVPDDDVAVREAVRRGYGVLRGMGRGVDMSV